MTIMTWLRGTTQLVGSAALALGLMACGSDADDPSTADAGTDEPCTGHGCSSGSSFDLPEGGEFRLELFESAGGDELLAGQAFFHMGQQPPTRSLSGMEIMGTGCADFRSGDNFDNGLSVEGQAILDTRTYLDVGETATLKSMATGSEIVLTKTTNEVDLSSSMQHDLLYKGGDPMNLERNVWYVPSVAGSADFPGLDLRSGVHIGGEDWSTKDRGLFFPPNFTLTTPADEEALAGITLTTGEDLTFAWTNDEEVDATAPDNISFAIFVNPDGRADITCVGGEERTGGTITVPASVVDTATETGTILVGKFTHFAWEQDGRRLDLLGINCKLVPYTRAAAQ